MAPILQPVRSSSDGSRGIGAMVMRQNILDVGMGHQVDAETVRRGPQVPPAELEKRAQVIASAAMDMIYDLKKLEDRCDGCAAEAHGAENTSTIT